MMSIWKTIKGHVEPLQRILQRVSTTIQSVVNVVLLSLVYFIPLGVVSIIAKYFFKKHFLLLHEDRTAASYWKEKKLGTEDLTRYYRMY